MPAGSIFVMSEQHRRAATLMRLPDAPLDWSLTEGHPDAFLALEAGTDTVAGLRIVHANPAVRHVLGMAPEALIGLRWEELECRVFLAERPEVLAGVLEHGTPWVDEQARPWRGEERWWRVTLTRARPGLLTLWLADITERQRLERQRSQARVQALIDHAPAVIYAKDTQGRFLFINRQFASLFGVRQEDVVGRTDHDFFPRALADAYQANDRRVLATRQPVEAEEVAPHPDGPHTYLSQKFPIPDGQGGFDAVCGISTDITREKRRAEFEQQLIGIVSHDLRNPLGAIHLGVSALLRRGAELEERTLRSLHRIQSATERASRMVRDLLDFTQARLGGGIPLVRQPVDLHALCRQVVDEAQSLFPERAVLLEQHGDGTGRWDGDRLSQALQNLLTNALKYSPADTPVSVVTRTDEDQAVVRIHNEGPPIPADRLASLFEPLQRGSTERSKADRSVGLGLYIVRHIVTAHGGAVQVQSTHEEGTTFTVRLPRAQAPDSRP